MSKKIILIIGGFFILISALIVKQYLFNDFFYVGTIEATRIDLSARLPSVIHKYLFNEGDYIKKGDLLVSLDCDDIDIVRNYAVSVFDRSEKLLKSGGIPKQSYDLALKNKLDAELKKSWCEIHSPINGKVLINFMDEEEWVVPGTKLISVADLSKVWAYIYVEQPLLSQLKVGMKIKGHIPEWSHKKFIGTITKINDEAEFTPKNVQTRSERSRLVFGIKVLFENTDELLKPGMSIEVDLPNLDG